MLKPLPLSPGAALLSRLWRMRGQETPYLSDSGDEFDSEALVSFRANRDPRVYQSPRQSNKGERVKLHILIDTSGSMNCLWTENNRRAAATNLALMAAQSAVMAGVEVLPLIFNDQLTKLPPCRTLLDVAGLSAILDRFDWNGTTQTIKALASVYQTAAANPAAAHVCVVITDGQPDRLGVSRHGRKKAIEADGTWTVRAMVDLMAESGIEVFGFMVADDRKTIDSVRTCFGSDRYAVAVTDHAAALALAVVVERFI